MLDCAWKSKVTTLVVAQKLAKFRIWKKASPLHFPLENSLLAENPRFPSSLSFNVELGELRDVVGDVDVGDLVFRIRLREVLGQHRVGAARLWNVDHHQGPEKWRGT